MTRLAACGLGPGAVVPVVEGGVVDMDAAGVPTGILRENACALITPFTEERDPAVRRTYFAAGVASLG